MKYLTFFAGIALLAACNTPYDPDSPEIRNDAPENNARVKEAMAKFNAASPKMKNYFEKSYGFAIYPKVRKGGAVVGGARGDGMVYEQNRYVGSSELIQTTIGAQIGGQSFAEVIFFRDKGVMDQFKKGKWRPGAQASAVFAKDAASSDRGYREGVAIFTTGNRGAMAEASVGAQKFSFEAK